MLKVFTLHPHLIGFTFPPQTPSGIRLLPKIGPDMLKQYPGIRYAPEHGKGVWVAPVEAADYLTEIAALWGLPIVGDLFPPPDDSRPPYAPSDRLYEYQREAVEISAEDGAHLLAFEMGLGKTAAAIDTLRLGGTAPILIVCPKVAVGTWEREIGKWWPDTCPQVKVIRTGKDTPDLGGINILSWGLMHPRLAEYSFGAIVLDEAHYASNRGAKRTKAVRALREANPDALCLALTGTPIADSPKDLWQQLDILFPGRFGSRWRFCERYCSKKPNKYRQRGYDYVGLDETHAAELEARLTYVSTRVTKKEVAHLLPPFAVTTLEIPWGGLTVGGGEKAYTQWLKASQAPKISACVEWIKTARESGVSHIAVMSHLRNTGAQIAEALKACKIDAVVINGDVPPEDREKQITAARLRPDSVVICTMASVGISINALAEYSTALFAELAYYPVEVLQAIARFYRLNSREPVSVCFCVSDSGPDAKIAGVLERKLTDGGKIFAQGVSEESITNALGVGDDWQEKLGAQLEALEGLGLDDSED